MSLTKLLGAVPLFSPTQTRTASRFDASFYERIPQQALHKGTPIVVVTLVHDSDEAEFVQHTEQYLRRPLQRLQTSDVGSIAF